MAESWEGKNAEFEARQEELKIVLETQKLCLYMTKDLANKFPEWDRSFNVIIKGLEKGIKYLEGEE